ncbi:MAG: hypothetical protein Q9204_007223 [Flavoplaca sp. TL-2023a]
MLEWPRREGCANLPDQVKSTAEHGQNLLLTIAEAPKCGSMMQMNQDSIVNFVKNVIHMCEMLPKPDPAELQDRSEGHDEPARHHEPAGVESSDQENVVMALDEIKKLKMEMDAKVAAVEAAIRTQHQPTALTLANGPGQDTGRISETLQTTTPNFASVPTFGEIGQLERTRTRGEASFDFRSDTPIFGSFRSTSQSALKPNSEAEGRARASKDNARVAESTKQPQIGAMATSGAAQVAAGTSSEASNPRAIVDTTTRTNDHMDPINTGLAALPISGISSTTDQVALQTPVREDCVQTSDGAVEQGAQPSARPVGDQPRSDCDVNESRSGIDQTAAASAVSGEASQTTQKPIHVSNNIRSNSKVSSCSSGQADGESDACSDGGSSTEQSAASSPSNEEASESTERAQNQVKNASSSEQTAMQSSTRASETASADGPDVSNDGTDVEGSDNESSEEENDGGTDSGDSGDDSSGDEDTEMEDTETSEQSEEYVVPDPKPINVWRTAIPKPENTGVPKSIRGVSPSQTIPAAPIKKRSGFLLVHISIRDCRIKSELQYLTQPELKYRLEREMLNKKSRIRTCKFLPSGVLRLRTTDLSGSKLLQKPSSWSPGAFGKGATVEAFRPRRNRCLR